MKKAYLNYGTPSNKIAYGLWESLEEDREGQKGYLEQTENEGMDKIFHAMIISNSNRQLH